MKKHEFVNTSSYRSCRGFSLFEVLITVVVVSIGLLGLAGLQFAGLRASNQAQDHTIATHLAQDAIERIRANQVQTQINPNSYITTLTPTSTPTNQNCSPTAAIACTSQQIVQYDLFQLSQMISAAGTPVLPNALINIATNPNTVTISWGDQGPNQTMIINY